MPNPNEISAMKTTEAQAVNELVQELNNSNQLVISLEDQTPVLAPRPEANTDELPAITVSVINPSELAQTDFAERIEAVLSILEQMTQYYRDKEVSRISIVATYDNDASVGEVNIQVSNLEEDANVDYDEQQLLVSTLKIAEHIRLELENEYGTENRIAQVEGNIIVGNGRYDVHRVDFDTEQMEQGVDFMGVKFNPNEQVIMLRTDTGNTYFVTEATYAYLMQKNQLTTIRE